MEGTHNPEFASGQFVGPGPFGAHSHALGARGLQHECGRHTGNARQIWIGVTQHIAAPPQQCAVSPLDDVTSVIDDDGFIGAEGCHGVAQPHERIKIGPFDGRMRAHVVFCRGQYGLAHARWCRAVQKPKPQVRVTLAQFEARKMRSLTG